MARESAKTALVSIVRRDWSSVGFGGKNIRRIPKNFTFEDKLNLKGKLTTINT